MISIDKGYACIKEILHANAQITDTVAYEGQDYSVVAMGTINAGLYDRDSVFGDYPVFNEAPVNLVLPDSVIYIGPRALQGCSSESVTLPEGLTVFSSDLSYSTNITSIVFPDSVTEIAGGSLFSGCTNLRSVSFPQDCTIHTLSGAFLECHSLESVSIPGTISRLGEMVFYNCYELTSVTLGEGIETIGVNTFANCPKLTSLVIPESVTMLEEQAFLNCPGLKDITLPDNITDVPANLFVNEYSQPADVSGLTIRVRADMVSYVQGVFPDATVVEK